MSLYGAFDKTKHLSELSEPLETQSGVLTPAARRLAALQNMLGDTTVTLNEVIKLGSVSATAEQLNDLDIEARTQNITAAVAVNLPARYVAVTGPTSSTYAITLAAPDQAGIVKIIEMIATTDANAVTLALTNVIGGSAATTASFNAAGETLTLVSSGTKWVVLSEVGVTLS